MAKILLDVCWDKEFTEVVIQKDYETGSMLDSQIRMGLKRAIILPDNATNGDVIKAMFPNSQVINHHSYVEFDIKDCEESQYYDCSWWNAPYKENEDGK